MIPSGNIVVSIIVPCYNYAHLLPKTLNSLLEQTFLQWECIVVDDGSRDDTQSVVADFRDRDDRFKYIYQENSGLSAARNTGIEHSTGRYLQFLDADDLVSSQKLELQLKEFDANDNCDLVYCRTLFFYEKDDGEIVYYSRYENILSNKSLSQKEGLKALSYHNFTVVNSPLIKRTLAEKIGGFNTSLVSNEDWDYWIRCSLNSLSFVYCEDDSAVALVRGHANSMSTNFLKMACSEISLRKRLIEKLKEFEGFENEIFFNENQIIYLTGVYVNFYSAIRSLVNQIWFSPMRSVLIVKNAFKIVLYKIKYKFT